MQVWMRLSHEAGCHMCIEGEFHQRQWRARMRLRKRWLWIKDPRRVRCPSARRKSCSGVVTMTWTGPLVFIFISWTRDWSQLIKWRRLNPETYLPKIKISRRVLINSQGIKSVRLFQAFHLATINVATNREAPKNLPVWIEDVWAEIWTE